MSSKRICNTFARAHVARGMVFAVTVMAGGCSTDVTRFDFPLFGLTQGHETGSLPTPSGSMVRNERGYDEAPGAAWRGTDVSDSGRGYAPAPGTGHPGERVASARGYELPPSPSYAPSSERYPGPPIERAPLGPPAAGSASIQVQQGDRL